MKKKNQKTKLILNKKTIVHLNRANMKSAWGGTMERSIEISCPTKCDDDCTSNTMPTEQGATCEMNGAYTALSDDRDGL